MIPIGTFDFSVTLFKMIDRKGTSTTAQPAVDAQRTIDLTDYFGESSVIKTMKSVREPAGGFSFSFGDQMDETTQDSVADLIEPMDMVELRVSRTPWKFSGQKLPLLMRGFVSAVRRSEVITDDGTPQRVITVRGQDFGKLWLINHVYSELAFVQEQHMLSAFALFAALGMDAQQFKISDYVVAMTTKVMNPKIDSLTAIAQHLVPAFGTNMVGTTEGTLVPSVAGTMRSGSLWSILNGFIDRPWNELFIVDTEAGPQMVFREVPYKDISGKLIMPNATDPGQVSVDVAEILELDVARTDDHVANFFWVPPGTSSLDTNGFITAGEMADPNVIVDADYGNNDPDLYGFRRMDAGALLVGDTATGYPPDQSLAQRQSSAGLVPEWFLKRAAQLKAMNRDNVVFEDGAVAVIGREGYVIGQNLQVTRGSITFEGYCHSVSHTIRPLNAWTTNAGIERCNGFLQRRKTSAAYLAEGRAGPYSPRTASASSTASSTASPAATTSSAAPGVGAGDLMGGASYA